MKKRAKREKNPFLLIADTRAATVDVDASSEFNSL